MNCTSHPDWHLRVGVLPNCNLRCRYCNPQSRFEHAPTLKDDEIIEIVQAAVANGIRRVHWTGGEPCLRDIRTLIERAREAGVTQQIMTTNGTLKSREVQAIREAGLDRVNISLDTLRAPLFKTITGCDAYESVRSWIRQACETFPLVTKMNVVVMKDNLGEIPEFFRFAGGFSGKLALKFIELCPNNPAFFGDGIQDYTVSRAEIIDTLTRIGPLTRTSGVGDNPNAEYYSVGDTGVQAILITMPSQDFKCGLRDCRKLRISPFGLAGSCIRQKGANLLGTSLEQKTAIIRDLIEIRESYSDLMPCSRRHFRGEYGLWRFGHVQSTECQK